MYGSNIAVHRAIRNRVVFILHKTDKERFRQGKTNQGLQEVGSSTWSTITMQRKIKSKQPGDAYEFSDFGPWGSLRCPKIANSAPELPDTAVINQRDMSLPRLSLSLP